jgi:hypothetical protein
MGSSFLQIHEGDRIGILSHVIVFLDDYWERTRRGFGEGTERGIDSGANAMP